MQYDYIIVGQGLSGTHTAWQLIQKGCHVLVIDKGLPYAASMAAAGIINPVSGRRFALAWKFDEVFQTAKDVYAQMEEFLPHPVFKETDIYSVWPSEQMKEAFLSQLNSGNPYLKPHEGTLYQDIDQPLGAGWIKGAHVNIFALLSVFRNLLIKKKALVQDTLGEADLKVDGKNVQFGDFSAKAIVFCDGAHQCEKFVLPGVVPAKGEAIIVEIPGWEGNNIVKKTNSLVPLGKGRYWYGATLQREFEHDKPTTAAKDELEDQLKSLISLPFKTVDVIAGVRATTVDRRPVVGKDPRFGNVYHCNGLGTKGSSLAPFAALNLVKFMEGEVPSIDPEMDLNRYFN